MKTLASRAMQPARVRRILGHISRCSTYASAMELAVAGFETCPFHQQALEAAKGLVASGAVSKLDDRTFPTRDQYRDWLFSEGHELFRGDERAQKHTSSPYVWTIGEDGIRFVGGCDDLLAMASSTVSAAQEGMVPVAGDRVHIAYKGTLKRDGSTFDSSEGKDPLAFVLGSGQVIPGFDEAAASMVVGESKTVELSPAEAYGDRKEDAVLSFPKTSAPDGLGIGDQVRLSSGAVATVIEFTDTEIRIDTNHRLAGETLIFELKLLQITPAAEVEDEDDAAGIIAQDQALPGRDTEMPLPDNSHFILKTPMRPPYGADQLEVAVVATGCFWGTEKGFWRLPGVYSSAVGYVGGHTPNPTYEEVCTGQTGHTEACLVVFDPAVISYADVLKQFWESHDPTQGMGQGNDWGTQYRSGIYCQTEEQQAIATASRAAYQKALSVAGRSKKITTEIKGPGSGHTNTFYFAEQEHQQYLAKPMARQYCSAQPTGVQLPDGGELPERKLPAAFWETYGATNRMGEPMEPLAWPL